jgi:hypothetical protein
MLGTSGTQYEMDGLAKLGDVVEYKITDTNWWMTYRLGDKKYFEQATSTDGFTYEGIWGEKGKAQKTKGTVKLERYDAKNGNILMLGEWSEGDGTLRDYIYRLSPDK